MGDAGWRDIGRVRGRSHSPIPLPIPHPQSLPDDRALEFSVEYAGVVAFGTGRLALDADEARHGLARIMEKYAPHLQPETDYEPPTPADLARTSVFRITLERMLAKEKVAPEDFPNAYRYEDVVR